MSTTFFFQDFETRMMMKKLNSSESSPSRDNLRPLDKKISQPATDVDSGTAGHDLTPLMAPTLTANDTQQIIANLLDFKVFDGNTIILIVDMKT